MSTPSRSTAYALGFAGAAVGGALGWWLAGWASRQGFYAMALPGGLLGLGFALAGRVRSQAAAVVCAIAALPLGLYTHWSNYKFVQDPSLGFFVQHLGDLRGMTWLMVGLGCLGAYWFAIGTVRR